MLNTGKLAGRTLLITGASRGIGKAIALKAARDGANIVIAAKTEKPHPKLPGTIYTAAEEVQNAGGVAYPVVLDVRDESAVRRAIEGAVAKFGGIDILVNNASAISLSPTTALDMKRYDLMHNINTRGTFLVSKECIPYLMKSNHAHILNISPPLNLNPRWFRDHVAYTMAKYGMSMCVLGMSGEFQDKGIGVNALWPRTAIYTAAIEMLQGKESMKHTRKPDIMADAAYAILTREPNRCTGNFFIDDEVLLEEGITDLSQYASDPNSTEDLMPDFFLDDEGPTEKKISSTINSNVPDDVLLSQIFNKIQNVLSEDVVNNVKSTYQFNIDDKKVKWYLDLKNGKGNCQNGECPNVPDVTLSMTSKNLSDMFSGNLKAIPAFMSGKLKISGDMQKAMKLEKLLRAYKSKL